MKTYLITDPKYFQNFKESLQKHKPDFACFRDKRDISHEENIKSFINVGREYSNAKLIVHSHLELALKYRADGFHVASSNFETIKYAKEKDLYVVASTHTIEEAQDAITQGANALTFSPIFHTPNKGEPLGLEKLKEIIDIIDAPIFALGGIITEKQISALKEVKPYGFASIRYFT